MKVKLLKKVRRRFEIVHHPKGIVKYQEHWDYNLFALYDSTSEYSTKYAQIEKPEGGKFTDHVFKTEKECINYLKDRIIAKLLDDGYENRKMRVARNTQTKVWWKP